ncbi:hypothetical protein K469DRAFT_689395 [Zopfia rhizophila CBS 207.26]|uniref:Putative zinc-finger domain-containing protein n=1 Tax=Zopfia rhizophila CBS 207.26 TaxID=1314779 RepID=A0A6A6E0F5_9PEZI|nr:hypothetical protein K469DRAFT_689395 [Zopfia rhizophila CBS 207.26]
MANYPQPPYGMPFQMSPQHPTPNPQGGPSDPRQPSIHENFQYNGNLPGLNLQSYAQNTRLPQYQQYWQPPPFQPQNGYSPLPFPPPFIGQNGFPIPPPPPPPGANFYPSVPQLPVQNAPVPNPSTTVPEPSVRPPQQSDATPRERFVEVVESDKEDGEVSEVDRVSQPPAAGNRIHPEPPRSVPQLHHDMSSVNAGGAPNGRPRLNDQPPVDFMYDRPLPPQAKRRITPEAQEMDSLQQKKEDAKRFVRLLNENNIGYSSLANEGLDAHLLAELYRELNFRTRFEPSGSQNLGPTNGAAPNHSKPPAPDLPRLLALSQQDGQAPINGNNIQDPVGTIVDKDGQAHAKPTTVVKTNVAQTPPVKSAPSPIDRKDYIARLQAAKTGKQAVAAKVTPPQNTPPTTAPSTDSAATAKATPPSETVTAQNIHNTKEHSDAEKARKTDLIRQKLEAIKSKQAASGQGSSQSAKAAAPASASRTSSFSSPIQKAQRPQNVSATIAQSSPFPQSPQTSQSIPAPSFSGIPGLFMTASSASSRATPPQPHQIPSKDSQKTVAATSRKRPVASDFDEISTPRSSGPSYTRPLGQSPHEHDDESMIIEVSDDESGGSEMDLDDDQGVAKPASVMSPPNSNRTSQQFLRNLPPLSNFPSRSASVKPASSAVSTPPAAQTPASLTHKEELNKKERDIAMLKQRIAELNQRNQKKKEQDAKNKVAVLSSPMPNKVGTQAVQNDANVPMKVASSVMLETSKPDSLSQPDKLIETPSSATPTASTDWRKQRRAEIQSGLPSLDADLASNNARLAQIMKEMEELQAYNRKVMQDKENLIRELENLGVDTEGMPHSELQAKKDEIVQQRETEAALQAEAQNTVMPDASAIMAVGVADPRSDVPEDLPQPEASELDNGQLDVSMRIDSTPDVNPVSGSNPLDAESFVTEEDMIISENGSPKAQRPTVITMTGSPQSEKQEVLLPTAAPAQDVTVPTHPLDVASPVDDEEDFYSPEPVISAPVQQDSEKTETTQTAADAAPETVTKSPSEEGEVEMSESSFASDDEEEYEPEEPQTLVAPVIPTLTTQENEVGSSSASSLSTSSKSSSSDEDEAYEPPDVDQGTPDVQPSAMVPPSVSGLQHLSEDVIEPDAMDIEMSSEESDSTQLPSTKTYKNKSISSSTADPSITVADDLAPEPQPQTVSQALTSVTEPTPATDTVAPLSIFRPYESPLRMFKSYRYHPNYSQDVAGGFLSMTYSHQIDPQRPLCRYEVAGVDCSDSQCDGQHFQGMGISGDKILVQLGTANPGKTPEEKQQWNDGLRGVLKELRLKNIKDPNVVAVEIAKYRRQFLQDDTRVVNF